MAFLFFLDMNFSEVYAVGEQKTAQVCYLSDVHGELMLGLKGLITQRTGKTPTVIFGFL